MRFTPLLCFVRIVGIIMQINVISLSSELLLIATFALVIIFKSAEIPVFTYLIQKYTRKIYTGISKSDIKPFDCLMTYLFLTKSSN